MKLITADLSANYEGRGKTELPRAVRLVMMKEDGTILIHNDRSYQPINYMTTVDEITREEKDGEVHLLFTNKKEKLEIILHEIIKEIHLDLDIDDPKIIREKTESDLQFYISENIDELDANFRFIQREFETGFGPVDILAKDVESGAMIAMEVKRNATMNSVYQVLRYADTMVSNGELSTQPVIAALSFNSSTLTLAESKGVRCIVVPEGWSEESLGSGERRDTLFDLI